MSINSFMTRQFARPHGFFGRLFMARILNQANQAGNDLAFDLMEVAQTDKVLEVGFGGGDLLLRFARTASTGKIEGLEISKPMLANLQRRIHRERLSNRISLHEGVIEALPFEESYFDCACSINTVYFWTDLRAGLRELARVLRPDGRLILGFGSDKDMRQRGYHERGFSLYSPKDIQAALEAEGLTTYRLERLEQPRGAFFASASRRQ